MVAMAVAHIKRGAMLTLVVSMYWNGQHGHGERSHGTRPPSCDRISDMEPRGNTRRSPDTATGLRRRVPPAVGTVLIALLAATGGPIGAVVP